MTPFAIHDAGKIKLRYWTTTVHYGVDEQEVAAWKTHLSNRWEGDPMRDEKAQALESILAAEREQEEWRSQNELQRKAD